MTVTSLYICISYIYTYPYKCYYLSSLHAYCMSISFPLHVLCIWHNFYLYFSCISVSIFCIFHIHSIIDCSMSLTFLLSILSYHLILSCTFIYILILFIYGTFVCFNLVLFMYYTFICFLPVLDFFIFQFYILLHSMYYYIYHFLSCTYIMSPFM